METALAHALIRELAVWAPVGPASLQLPDCFTEEPAVLKDPAAEHYLVQAGLTGNYLT